MPPCAGHVHARPRGPPPVARRGRALPRASPADVLDFLDARAITRHLLRGGRDRRAHPDLVRRDRGAGPRDRPARVAPRAAHRADARVASRPTSRRGKALLEDLAGSAGASASGRRRSRSYPTSRWAIDVLRERLHLLVERAARAGSPLFGDPGAAGAHRSGGPTAWSSCRARSCARAALGLPYLGGVYLRCCPGRRPAAGAPRTAGSQLLWTYCHPYDFDPDEAFWVVPDAGSARQPAALVQPPPHVRQDRGGARAATRPVRPLAERSSHRGPRPPA